MDRVPPMPNTPMRTQGAIQEGWPSPAVSEQSLHEMKESLRQEMDMNNQIILQQLKNEQAASMIRSRRRATPRSTTWWRR